MTELSGVISVVFILYVVLMLGIGWVTSRKATSPSQFFLADRSLKAWVTAVSSTASSESAWAVLGTVGLVYKEGLSSIWFLPGCLMGYAINWLLLAERLRKHSHETNAITIPDYLESHFNDKTNLLRLISVIIIFACMMAYVGAQFAAIGKTFDAIFGVPHHVSIPIGAAIIIVYTMMGGFLAVAWTDFVQGLIMVFGLVLLAVIAVVSLGGIGGAIEHLSQVRPQTLDWMGGRTVGAFFGFMVGLLGIGLGYPGQPHVLNRYMAAKDTQTIRHGVWIAMGWGLLVYSSAIVLGLCGHALFPGLEDPEHLFPKAAELLLPTVVSAVVLTGVLAAIMSTVSAQIIVAASAVAHDVCTKMISRDMTHKQIILISRISVVLLGLGAMVIALMEVPVIFWFVLFAWSGLGASFGPVILFTLYSKNVTREGAIAGMLTGFITTLVWKWQGLSDSLIYELVPAFALASLAVWGVSRCTTGKTEGATANENLLSDELSAPTGMLKIFSHALASDSSHATYKIYRELYQLGESVIPAIETQLLAYKWDDIKYDLQMKILSGFLSLANDLDEERAREIGDKIRRKGCSKGVDASIKSILNFSLDEFKIYPINGVVIYQSKSLSDETRIKKKMSKWLSMVPDEDLKEIERLYLIPTHEKYSGTYMPILYNIMVVWDLRTYYNPLSYFRLLWIEHTLYHEIGHHVCRHTFGQDPEQEKEADRYAAGILKKTHPILNKIVRALKFVFGKKKTGESETIQKVDGFSRE